jgi:hypothetical protein
MHHPEHGMPMKAVAQPPKPFGLLQCLSGGQPAAKASLELDHEAVGRWWMRPRMLRSAASKIPSAKPRVAECRSSDKKPRTTSRSGLVISAHAEPGHFFLGDKLVQPRATFAAMPLLSLSAPCGPSSPGRQGRR